MKTRVIQDEPEPTGHHSPADLCAKQMQKAMNVAGRMGHWSATHWKTAVFGWLACVVLLFAFGNIALGLKQIDINDAGVIVGDSSSPSFFSTAVKWTRR